MNDKERVKKYFEYELLLLLEECIDLLEDEEIKEICLNAIEECRKSSKMKKAIAEIVDRQLMAGENNCKEFNDTFSEIVNIVKEYYPKE